MVYNRLYMWGHRVASAKAYLPAFAFSALLFLWGGAPAAHAFVFGLRTQAEVSVTQDPLWPAKVQPGGKAGLIAEFDLGHHFRFVSALGYHYTGRSNLEGGVLYRAHSGLDLRGGFGLVAGEGSSRLTLGLAAGGYARIDSYQYTRLFFFYPGVFVEPFLEGRPDRPWRNLWQLGFPVELSFRRDLELCLTVGMGLTLPVFPSRIWKPRDYR
jgi:hypothetical protein